MDDDSEEKILEKFDALRKVNLKDVGLLRATELHQIITAQMDLTIELFKKQHDGIKKLTKYSNRLEILTAILTALTVILIGVSIYEGYRTDESIGQLNNVTKEMFTTDNFNPQISFLIGTPIVLEQRNYSDTQLIDHITISSDSPHTLMLMVKNITLDPITDCQFPEPHKVKLEKPFKIYIDKGVNNLDIPIPFRIDLTELYPSQSFVTVNSTNTSILTKLNVNVDLIDLQTHEHLDPNTWIPTDILVHKTHISLCPLRPVADAIKLS